MRSLKSLVGSPSETLSMKNAPVVLSSLALSMFLGWAFDPSRSNVAGGWLAYIDPGLGAMVVQAVAAAFFGAIFYFKNLKRAIGRIFMRLTGKTPDEAQAAGKK